MASVDLPTITVPATVGGASAGVQASNLSSFNRTFNYTGLQAGDTLDLQGANADVSSDYASIRRITYGGTATQTFTIVPENSQYYRVLRVQKDPNNAGTGRTLIVSGTDATVPAPVVQQARVASPSPVVGYTTGLVLSGAGKTVYGISVQTGTASGGADTMPTGTYYLMLLDAVSVPVSGTTSLSPLFVFPVDHVNGVRDNIVLGDEQGGFTVTLGAVFLLSSNTTITTYTSAAGSGMLVEASVSH